MDQKAIKDGMTIGEMLETGRSFDELIAGGYVFSVKTAAERTGFSEWYLRELCQEKKINHFQRNGTQYFFYPRDLKAFFKDVKGAAR